MGESEYPIIPIVSGKSRDGGQDMIMYLDTKPYPSVDAGPPDLATVALLKQDMAGSVSELTGIAQYLFQNTRATENKSFANAILQIAIVEMHHLDMLGDAVQALGGKPSYDNGKTYWQAGYANYSDSLPAMLQADIDAEKGAIANYEKHAAETKNPQVRALFFAHH